VELTPERGFKAGLTPLLAAIFVAVVALTGCARPVVKCPSPEDNPAHHYIQGMELIDRGDLDGASAKFQRALYCDEGFSPAHAGLAIAEALRSGSDKPEGYRKADIEAAAGHLTAARKGSDTPEDEFAYHLAVIRVNTRLMQGKWLKEALGSYEDAMKLKVDETRLLYYDGMEAGAYFMGLAYLRGREFEKARGLFADVLNRRRDGRWNAPAEAAWKKVDKIVRALAGITVGDVGKEIALRDSVTRGDMAALLIDELKVGKLFAGRIPLKPEAYRADFVPADALSSPFKEEVTELLKWGVRGLEPSYDETTRAYLFRPDGAVTRKDLALVLEDVIIKLTGDESLATAFFGHDKSPFPDVSPSSAWYNAVMNVTTRTIMEAEFSGEFRPDDRVDGAEAMLALRVLRQRMNIY
jgi:tetratricopeptide (TPR) repeat protein